MELQGLFRRKFRQLFRTWFISHDLDNGSPVGTDLEETRRLFEAITPFDEAEEALFQRALKTGTAGDLSRLQESSAQRRHIAQAYPRLGIVRTDYNRGAAYRQSSWVTSFKVTRHADTDMYEHMF